MSENEKLAQKRQQCWNKQTEIQLKISELEKELSTQTGVYSDIDIITSFLTKKFGFDLQAEKAKLIGCAAKSKMEIASLRAEIHKFRKCWEEHYACGKIIGYPGQAEKNAAICEKCQFKPFYTEEAQQENDIAKRKEKREQQQEENAKAKQKRVERIEAEMAEQKKASELKKAKKTGRRV